MTAKGRFAKLCKVRFAHSGLSNKAGRTAAIRPSRPATAAVSMQGPAGAKLPPTAIGLTSYAIAVPIQGWPIARFAAVEGRSTSSAGRSAIAVVRCSWPCASLSSAAGSAAAFAFTFGLHLDKFRAGCHRGRRDGFGHRMGGDKCRSYDHCLDQSHVFPPLLDVRLCICSRGMQAGKRLQMPCAELRSNELRRVAVALRAGIGVRIGQGHEGGTVDGDP